MSLVMVSEFLAGRSAAGLVIPSNQAALKPPRKNPRAWDGSEIDRSRPWLCAASGGRYVKVTIPHGGGQRERGKRRAITQFSWSSKRALLTLVNSIDQTKCSGRDFFFVTLTYPGEFPVARATKQHLAAFRRRWERKWGQTGIVWRLEAQKRGAPHYHLLVYAPGGFYAEGEVVDLHVVRMWLSHVWYEVVGSGDLRHLRAGTQLEQVRSFGGVATYVGKYMGKVDYNAGGGDAWCEPGRLWGVWRRERLPITYERVNVERGEAVKLRRMMVRKYETLGSGRWYIRWPLSGRVERRYMPREVAEAIKAENDGIIMFEYKRKWRRRSGGISGFIKYDDVRRYIERCW